MEIRQLEHFVAVAEEHHFTRAATRCNITQSALSGSIRRLEAELDTPLFVRTTRRVDLTVAGQALLEEARSLLHSVERARELVSGTKGRLGGYLSVGGIQTAQFPDQAALMARFRALHPDVNLRYSTGTSIDLIDDVRARRVDVAFLSVPRTRPTALYFRPLQSAPLMLVCRPDHRLATSSAVDLMMLAGETFVGGPPRSANNAAIERVFRAGAIRRELRIQAYDIGSMLDFVAHGLGVALLPGYLAASHPPLVAVPLADPSMIWTVGIATAPLDTISEATRAFLGLVDGL